MSDVIKYSPFRHVKEVHISRYLLVGVISHFMKTFILFGASQMVEDVDEMPKKYIFGFRPNCDRT